MFSAVLGVESKITEVIHPLEHLINLIKTTPPTPASPKSIEDYKLWQLALSPYVTTQFHLASPNETLELYFFNAQNQVNPEYLSFKDTNQDDYLDKPTIESHILTVGELNALSSFLESKQPKWLQTTLLTKLDPAEQIYWHYAVPIYTSTTDEKPIAMLILRGPFSIFAKTQPQNKNHPNPFIAITESDNQYLSKTQFFPFATLSAYQSSPSELHVDASTKKDYRMQYTEPYEGTAYTILSKKMFTGWTLLYAFPAEILTDSFNNSWKLASLMATLFVLIITIFIMRIADYIEAPILELIHQFKSLDSQEVFPKLSESLFVRSDELGILITVFEQLGTSIQDSKSQLLSYQALLEKQVVEKNKALLQTHELLSESIERLRQQEEALDVINHRLKTNLESIENTQHQLMLQEKSSSLKYLTAGVAHELNTPIGNAITLATYLENEYHSLSATLTLGNLSNAQALTSQISIICEAVSQLTHNIEQANQIVTLLETITPDRNSQKIETFVLYDFLDSLLQTMTRHTSMPIQVKIKCPTNLEVTTNVQQLTALLQPLVQNTLDHGFSKKSSGEIQFTIQETDSGIILNYSDNGTGIPEANRPHIFTPFYTTQFGHHKGLGLNLAYNIATFYFKGSLELLSTNSLGTYIRCHLYF